MEFENRPIIAGVSDLEDRLYAAEPRERSFLEKATDWYFSPKSFERSGKLYEALGVRPFKRLVMGTFGRLHKRYGADKTGSNYYIGQDDRNTRGLKIFELTTRFNECIHAPFTATCGWLLAEDLGNNNYSKAIVSGIGFLINGYCTILQRYNRARVYNTLDILAQKRTTIPQTTEQD